VSNERAGRVSHRTYVSYIDKSREYYAAHGYQHPYRWAQYQEVPFVTLTKPLTECRVALLTTSSVLDATPTGQGRRPSKQAYASAASTQPAAMYTADLSWDKDATNTDDVGSFLPLSHLAGLAADGVIGSVSPRFYGIPTDYSQRRTREVDAPEVVRWCEEDEVDVIVLVPL
jgi:D-proline reductase (dithiol) PrdB